ncbi:hypothetical protein [[Phormidium] sp. ETS-05]|uniref:hypothetical protein n=1 Tax=[Phormidium] sp. ETS-05 TaxID=222819 RepID=UPI001E589A24
MPVKEPSLSGSSLVPVQMEFTYESSFKDTLNTPAYLRLLYHILNGDNSIFASPVEALEALRIADELEGSNPDFVKYPVGCYPVEAKDWLPSELHWV